MKYANAHELVVMGQTKVVDQPGAEAKVVDFPMARVLITTEVRTSHMDAVKRLKDIAVSRAEPARYLVPRLADAGRQSNTMMIAACGNQLYQSLIWRYTGTPCSGATSCPGWQLLDNDPQTKSMAVGGF
ncbi:MAG: hypothetical protein ACRD44_04415 [Bryobacteraceae bacterium]